MQSPKTCLHSVLALLAILASAAWAETPRIAVTDLSYEEKVRGYFESIDYQEKYDHRGSSRDRYHEGPASGSGHSSDSYRDKGEISFKGSTGLATYIDRGELRKFTGDIKGGLIKAGYRVVQGKPWTQTNTEKLYDIINRIKQGFYPGADYVLFGTITNVEFREEHNPIQGSNAVNHSLALELVAEFSLINTKNYEIKAAFSVMGEGNDSRLVNMVGQMVTLNRSKVMFQVTKSLGENVVEEISGQFAEGAGTPKRSRAQEPGAMDAGQEEKTVIYR